LVLALVPDVVDNGGGPNASRLLIFLEDDEIYHLLMNSTSFYGPRLEAAAGVANGSLSNSKSSIM
jgi:hypothetical protein